MSKVTSVKDMSTDEVHFNDIKSWYDNHLSPDVIDFNDQKPYEIYEKGRFAGIFQLTSRGAQQLFIKAKPKSIIDIATLTSIYRPGPLAAKLDKLYLEIDENPYDWGDQRINDILKKTKGLLIFQESVMELAEKCAGFPKDKCDEVRRAIMKRSISGGEAAKTAAQETRDSFVQGCIKNGYSETVSNNLYDKILYFAGYGFNKCFTSKEKVLVKKKNTDEVFQVEIQHIKSGDIIVSRDEITKETILIQVKHLHNNGYNEVVKVELTSGEVIECTLNHKFRTTETGEMLPLWVIKERGLSIVVNDALQHLKATNGLKNML